jgi:hypothetical protein
MDKLCKGGQVGKGLCWEADGVGDEKEARRMMFRIVLKETRSHI